MDNIILIYYEDKSLGKYFIRCKEDIEPLLREKYPDAKFIEIKNHNCNQLFVDTKLTQLESNGCLFVAFSHGLRASLMGPVHNPYIEMDVNDHLLINSFVITNSCYSGIELGPSLIQKGAKMFVGFKDMSWVYPEQNNNHYSEFILCDNFPLKLILKSRFRFMNKDEIEKSIKDFYNSQIDKLYKKNYFAATKLMANRNNCILLFPEP